MQDELITSVKNPIIRHTKLLATSAHARKKADQSVLEGAHLLQSALDAHLEVLQIIVSEAAATKPEVQKLLQQVDSRTIYFAIDSVVAAISNHVHGGDIIAIFQIPKSAGEPHITKNAVLLDAVQDPGNLGTILRTAAAAGVSDIFCSLGCADAWNPKVLRAAMGAHFSLTIYQQCNLGSLIQSSEILVYATSLEATLSLYDCELSQQSAWIFGNEGAGVSHALLKSGVQTVIIPQESSVESLNVSASAAVCLFEQYRQQK